MDKRFLFVVVLVSASGCRYNSEFTHESIGPQLRNNCSGVVSAGIGSDEASALGDLTTSPTQVQPGTAPNVQFVITDEAVSPTSLVLAVSSAERNPVTIELDADELRRNFVVVTLESDCRSLSKSVTG
jgi:hypothetical protein